MRAMMMLALLGLADPEPDGAERKALLGTWVMIDGEAGGKAITKADLAARWTFKAGGKSVFAAGAKGEESPFTYAIDPSGKVKTIDLTYEGPLTGLKGTRQFGIYKLEGDRLTLCLSAPGTTAKDRPTAFTTEGSRFMLLRLEREKGGK
jgi:uncharacterized protein (TIGR03067 family)